MGCLLSRGESSGCRKFFYLTSSGAMIAFSQVERHRSYSVSIMSITGLAASGGTPTFTVETTLNNLPGAACHVRGDHILFWATTARICTIINWRTGAKQALHAGNLSRPGESEGASNVRVAYPFAPSSLKQGVDVLGAMCRDEAHSG